MLRDEGPGGTADEYIMLALRLREGLRFADYRNKYGELPGEAFFKAAKELQKNGLLRITPDVIHLTVKGFLVSNAVIAYLLQNT